MLLEMLQSSWLAWYTMIGYSCTITLPLSVSNICSHDPQPRQILSPCCIRDCPLQSQSRRTGDFEACPAWITAHYRATPRTSPPPHRGQRRRNAASQASSTTLLRPQTMCRYRLQQLVHSKHHKHARTTNSQAFLKTKIERHRRPLEQKMVTVMAS